jgi:GntR family transcriptional regulator
MEKIKLENTQVPLHYQISEYIEIMISRGEISFDEPLMPEERLKDIFGVSRTTIRRSIEHLRERGLLERGRGKGTFWTDKARQLVPEKKSGVNRLIFGVNDNTKTKEIDKAPGTVPEDAIAFLNIPAGELVQVFTRVRYSGDRPMSYTVNYLKPVYSSQIKKTHLEKMTMLETLEKICGVELGTIEHQVEIFRATSDIASRLGISALDPTLCVNTRVHDIKGEPVEIVWTYFVEKMYRFRVVL